MEKSLTGLGALILSSFWGLAALAPMAATDITFIVATDPHYGKPGEEYALNRTAIIPAMNALPGKPFPASVGGGPIGVPQGVLIPGDLVEKPDAGQWKDYVTDYGVNGEGRLKWPVYDALGNHDEPPNQIIVTPFKARNRLRKNAFNDTAAYFYSWDWGQVHFVNLNLYSGTVRGTGTGNPLMAVDFLKQDLAKHVGISGRPVVVMQHYQFDNGSSWWDASQKLLTQEVLKGYNVIALIHGHSHGKKLYTWQNIDVLDAGTAMNGDLLLVRIKETRMFVVNRIKEEWGLLKLDKTITLGKPMPTPITPPLQAAPGREWVFSVSGENQVVRATGDFGRVEVLDAFGRLVRQLPAPSGDNRAVTWDRLDEKGRAASPGIHFLKFSGQGTQELRKLILR